MEKMLSAAAEKLYERRAKDAPAKKDYKTLLEMIRGERYDDSVNASEELTRELDRELGLLRPYQKYCLEETWLYGKTIEQLTDEFRSELDFGKFAEKYIETVSKKVRDEAVEFVREMIDDIKENSFRELREDRSDSDSEDIVTVNSSIVDIVKFIAEDLDGADKMIFEKYYLQGETNEQIAEWLSENFWENIMDICRSAVRRMRIAAVPRGFNKVIDAKKLS